MTTILTQNVWTLVGTGLTALLIEAVSDGVTIFIGAVAPAATKAGFTLPRGIPVNVPSVAALGGGVWVRASNVNSGVRYASA